MRMLFALVLAAGALLPDLPGLAAPAAETPPLDPNMPANIISERRTTLEHGLRLVQEGDLEFARGHFAGVILPMPCRVQLIMDGIPTEQREAFHKAALAGMALWNRAFPDSVRYVEERNPDLCRVQVYFVPTIAAPDKQTNKMHLVCGITHVDERHDGLGVNQTATIQVAFFNVGTRQPCSEATITHVVAHELGHVIGMGELADVKHVMGPNGREPAVALTPEDIGGARAVLDYERSLVAKYGMPAPQPPPPAVGKPAAELGAPALDGKDVKLADLRGKVVLLDFWATWCGPCRAELPHVLSVWNAYRDKGLTIVGVSLDGKLGTPPPLDAVKSFTAENKMDWTQIVEGKGWQSDIGRRYRVYAIPFTCLIDRHGKVIGMNLRGQALADAIAKAVGAPGITLK